MSDLITSIHDERLGQIERARMITGEFTDVMFFLLIHSLPAALKERDALAGKIEEIREIAISEEPDGTYCDESRYMWQIREVLK